MKLLSVLLLTASILIGGCQYEGTSTDDSTKQKENTEMNQEKPKKDNPEENQTIQKPDYTQIESTFKERLIVETDNQSKVKDFYTKEALVEHLETILATDLAKGYVDRYYHEENDGLYLETQDSPVWLDTEDEFESTKQSEKEYRVVQQGENQLLGEYELMITYQYKEEQWKITSREVERKENPKAKEENNEDTDENSSNKSTTSEDNSSKNKNTANQDQPNQEFESNEDKKNTEKNHKDEKQQQDPKPTENSPKIVDNPNSILVVANKTHHLPESFVPNDLVETPVPFPFEEDLPKKMLRAEAASALDDMFKAANSQGLDLFAQSGYRSYDRQEAIFASNVDRYGSKEKANQVSAEPGESEHQTGLAMDVTSPAVNYRLVQSFDQTEEGQWVLNHAHEYGFIIRYPKGDSSITGYDYEPWHLRYVGKKAANYIHSKQITLEEYLGVQ